jgi:hypothetical protein
VLCSWTCRDSQHSHSNWLGKAGQPTREPEAPGVAATDPVDTCSHGVCAGSQVGAGTAAADMLSVHTGEQSKL